MKKLSLTSLSTERLSSGRLPSKMALSKECWEGDCFSVWWRRPAATEGEDSSERWPCSLQTHTHTGSKSKVKRVKLGLI